MLGGEKPSLHHRCRLLGSGNAGLIGVAMAESRRLETHEGSVSIVRSVKRECQCWVCEAHLQGVEARGGDTTVEPGAIRKFIYKNFLDNKGGLME